MGFPSWLPLGLALRDYHQKGGQTFLRVHTYEGSVTPYPAHLFFRDYEEFSMMDEQACAMARGRVLDAGAGAGCISLFLQNEMGMEVTAIDISQHCVEIMQDLGVKDARQGDIFELEGEQFDTILLLMNGIGFVGKLEGLDRFLEHVKSLLAPGGQILFDSSDLRYADIDGTDFTGEESKYYGEVWYQLEYKSMKADPYYWLYIDPKTLREHAEAAGYEMEVVLEGDDGYFFVQLKLQEN